MGYTFDIGIFSLSTVCALYLSTAKYNTAPTGMRILAVLFGLLAIVSIIARLQGKPYS